MKQNVIARMAKVAVTKGKPITPLQFYHTSEGYQQKQTRAHWADINKWNLTEMELKGRYFDGNHSYKVT